jgi:predicted ATPase
MKYCETSIDNKLRRWFKGDLTKGLLRGIQLDIGELRGLTSFEITIDFPIFALAGKNGVGKSTILALACCAYHNESNGYHLPKRNTPYYTFSDFFIQHPSELSPQGIRIYYGIAYDKWKKSKSLPEGIGIGWQERIKKQRGKWNNYDKRASRNVVFLGIDRIVPHAERGPSRSYSRAFKQTARRGWEDEVKKTVGTILDKKYDDFRYFEHLKYSLPVVTVGKTVYSGFNMGAGENALFEIFSILHDCGKGALLVIDEIELGLHAEAQRKFMNELKRTCLKLNAQVICTTHSREIFEQLPDDARYFVENINGKTKILNGISSDYAFSKLSGIGGGELSVFVEDDVAKSLLTAALPAEHRTRITISAIGSANCLARQLAAIYLHDNDAAVLSIFDGDQRTNEGQLVEHASKMAEISTPDKEVKFNNWIKNKMGYLPGDTWPEAWLMQVGQEVAAEIATAINSDSDSVIEALISGKNAGKHNELYTAGKKLGLERESFMQHIACATARKCADDFTEVVNQIKNMLN